MVPDEKPFIERSTMKHDIPVWSRLRRFSSSVQQKNRKLSAKPARLIHIFSPFNIHSSPSRLAVDRAPTTSEPAPGSVKPYVAIFSPRACGTRYFCFCSSVPHDKSVSELRPV